MNHHTCRHPESLRIFFMTEMWERYGFYVVQTLLILYLTFHFKWDDATAFKLVGAFTAMTYISSLAGGWIADQCIGQKRAIVVATFILMASYAALSLFQSSYGLIMSLSGICVGAGLLKPNISSLLGNEYPLHSARRQSGFTIFYIGITTGIILGSTVPNLLHQKWGWPVAFFSAAIGMIFACFIFIYGAYRYKIADYHPFEHTHRKVFLTVLLMLLLYFGAIQIFNYPRFGNSAFSSIVLFCIGYLIYAAKIEQAQQRRQHIVIALLCVISTLFWTFYFQMFSSFTLLITRIVEPTLLGITFPAPYYVAVQSLGLVLFGLLLARPKQHANVAIEATHIGKKFTKAMFLMTLAYATTTLILHFNHSAALLSPLFIIPVYLMISAAEMLLSPTGLAAITLLSSPKQVSTMMGIFFVSLGTGGFLSGKLACLAAVPLSDASIATLKIYYSTAFGQMFVLLALATVFSWFVNVLIQSLLKVRDN